MYYLENIHDYNYVILILLAYNIQPPWKKAQLEKSMISTWKENKI